MAIRRKAPNGKALGFRSGLEELIQKDLKSKGVPFEYETRKVRFIDPAKVRHYTPDFILPSGIIIESKGRFIAKDRQKHMLIKDQYPQLEIRFVFSRGASPICKGSKTTLTAWAKAGGFLCADKLIPESWLREAGKPEWIAALAALLFTKPKR